MESSFPCERPDASSTHYNRAAFRQNPADVRFAETPMVAPLASIGSISLREARFCQVSWGEVLSRMPMCPISGVQQRHRRNPDRGSRSACLSPGNPPLSGVRAILPVPRPSVLDDAKAAAAFYGRYDEKSPTGSTTSTDAHARQDEARQPPLRAF